MDVNGTRFHLVQGAADWGRCQVAGPATIALGEGASLRPLLFQLPARDGGGAGDPADARRGGARDRYGNWYWVDETRTRVLARSVGSNALGTFWPAEQPEPPPVAGFGPIAPPPAPRPCRFGGLAVTEDHFLVAGTLDAPGLLVFDLHAGGPPRHLRWPAGVPFQPFDLAPRPGGGVFVLDRENLRYWALDRQLGILDLGPPAPPAPETFGPASGLPDDLRPAPAGLPAGLSLAASSPLGASDPVAIEALPDGSVLILDRLPAPSVHRYCLARRLGSRPLDLSGVQAPTAGPTALGADLAFVAGSGGASDRLYVPSADGAQAYAFTLTFTESTLEVAADPAAPFLPMRLFGGKGLVAAGGGAWYDFDDSAWVPLVEQRRPRFEGEGVLVTPAFDGRDPGCVWHRLFLDGCLPGTAQVEIASRAADQVAALEQAPWSPEPALRRRPTGSELPLAAEPGGQNGTFELLFQRARGRFLQLRLRLRGDGRSSPRLRALRVWYPRFSYLDQYLPALYREDAESASFLDRFLANLEGLFTGVEDRMAVAQALLDARTAPAEALDWLAGWFGVTLDPAWTEPRRRLFLRHAMDFFRMRGTMRGLATALRLVIDDCAGERLFAEDAAAGPAGVRILEAFRLRRLPPLALGDPSAQVGIRQVTQPPRWSPGEGGEALSDRWRQHLGSEAPAPAGPFPLVEPADAATAARWRPFAAGVLGFIPAAGAREQQEWRDFLARRYRRVAAFNLAHGTAAAGFDQVALPTELPPDGAPLADWHQFQSGALAARRSAHRFTVLLPVPAREAFALAKHQQRRELARRIIELEKPAHTLFDIKFYWAMFRVGEARLAVDTLLDQGSRAPELRPPLVLGQGFLGESHLAGTPAERERERSILGAHPLPRRTPAEEKRS